MRVINLVLSDSYDLMAKRLKLQINNDDDGNGNGNDDHNDDDDRVHVSIPSITPTRKIQR